MIALKNFDEAKQTKKNYKHIDTYYIGYITIKRIDDYENIHSVNPLYLVIHSVKEHFEKKDENKYLILDLTKNMKNFSLELDQKSEEVIVEKNFFKKKKTTLKLRLILIIICL